LWPFCADAEWLIVIIKTGEKLVTKKVEATLMGDVVPDKSSTVFFISVSYKNT